jgi:CIC family chloride channel protein
MSSTPHRHSVVYLSVTAIFLAAMTTVAAWALIELIDLITNLAFHQRFSFASSTPATHRMGAVVILVPVVGGLIVGLMARYGSKAIRGHGIPEAMEQILLNRSRIPARLMLLKPGSAAVSIGTGGPFGAEGPIIATGAAFGSVLGQIFSVTARERKILLAAGSAAGMTAIFGSPISAVLLAIELLLFEFSAHSIVPVGIACAVASALRTYFFESGPVFGMPAVAACPPPTLFIFLLMGAAMGVAAAWLSRTVYWVEDQFERLPIHWMWWPAIGAVAVGVIGFFAPRTLGVGYENIEDVLANALPMKAVVALCFMKFLSWVIALGSGTSGGTLAPMLTIGSGLGAMVAVGLNTLFPALHVPVGLSALVGMTAIFAGASRAVLASIVFGFETTMQPEAFPALLAGGIAAFLVAHLISKHSIMTEKIARRGVPLPQSYEPDALSLIRVADVMAGQFQVVPDSMTVSQLASDIAANQPAVSRRHASLIMDEQRRLVGIITRTDILKAVELNRPEMTVAEAGSRNLVVVHPDDTLRHALTLLLQKNIGRLPVVDRDDAQRVVGYLGRAELLRAETTETKEPGLLERMFNTPTTQNPSS